MLSLRVSLTNGQCLDVRASQAFFVLRNAPLEGTNPKPSTASFPKDPHSPMKGSYLWIVGPNVFIGIAYVLGAIGLANDCATHLEPGPRHHGLHSLKGVI